MWWSSSSDIGPRGRLYCSAAGVIVESRGHTTRAAGHGGERGSNKARTSSRARFGVTELSRVITSEFTAGQRGSELGCGAGKVEELMIQSMIHPGDFRGRKLRASCLDPHRADSLGTTSFDRSILCYELPIFIKPRSLTLR